MLNNINSNKSKEIIYYHLSCNYCGKDWVMNEAFPKFCPYCGHLHYDIKDYTNCAFGRTSIKDHPPFYTNKCKIDKECSSCDKWKIKDCTTCKHGHFNDRFNTYFCDGDLFGECKNWSLWELKDEV